MRLIDADKLTEEWLDAENEPVYCANDVLSSIDEQPTVDAIEVVWCKNCENRNNQIENKFYGFCVIQEHFTGDDDYCIYGKRIGGGLEDKPAIEVKNAFVAVPNGNQKDGGSKMIEVEILPNHTKEYMKGYCDAIDEMELKDFIQVIRCENCELKLTVDCPMCECISTDTEQWLNTWGTPNGYCYLRMPRKENI